MTTSTDESRSRRPIKQESPARRAVDQSNDVVRKVLQALMGFYDLTPEQIARALGMSKATAYRRINGDSALSAGEIYVMSRVFECTTDDIYNGVAQFYPGKTIKVPDDSGAGPDGGGGASVTGPDTGGYLPATLTADGPLFLVTGSTVSDRSVAARYGSSCAGDMQHEVDFPHWNEAEGCNRAVAA